MIPLFAANLQRPGARIKTILPEDERFGQIMKQCMLARLGLEREYESAIRIDINGFDGVHLDGDGETHFDSQSGLNGWFGFRIRRSHIIYGEMWP